jgi:Ser/Thr protein kinase RdoA (MazF antagonist)
LFAKNELIGILDFDWACPGPFIKDVAHSCMEWSFPDGLLTPWLDVFKYFLDAYIQIFRIDIRDVILWCQFSALSDSATYLIDRLKGKASDTPERIDSWMYVKYKFFSQYKSLNSFFEDITT